MSGAGNPTNRLVATFDEQGVTVCFESLEDGICRDHDHEHPPWCKCARVCGGDQ